jgi:hypothetical protein
MIHHQGKDKWRCALESMEKIFAQLEQDHLLAISLGEDQLAEAELETTHLWGPDDTPMDTTTSSALALSPTRTPRPQGPLGMSAPSPLPQWVDLLTWVRINTAQWACFHPPVIRPR